MDPRLLAYATRQAPRYTSYPPAPHFTAGVEAETFRGWLGALPTGSAISLYVHVPYCRQLCWYCGCNTYAARRDEPLQQFVQALLSEIELIADASSARRVTEIHWGGGTPNILSADAFSEISQRIACAFDTSDCVHHAIEIDPRHLDDRKAQAYVRAGVNRASLGVQDLNGHVQRAIGRVQPAEIVSKTVSALRAAGIQNISMDLMYGLPHQSTEDLRRTVQTAAFMQPDRISLFGYAHVPCFKKRQRLIADAALPGSEERFDQATAARADLEALGYIAIGLDHFALASDELTDAQRTGRLRRSFQGYVAEVADAIIGLGPSSISTLPHGYAQNASEPGEWSRAIASNHLATARGHALSADDQVRRKVIEQLMCDFVADLAPLGGSSACHAELAHLAPMFADGLIQLQGDQLRLTEKGKPYCRLAAFAFDTYAVRGITRHSNAV